MEGSPSMALDKAAESVMGAREEEMEKLYSKLMSLVPQDYQLDTLEGSSDLSTQLRQATTYIRDLRARVEKLKRRRDDCYAKLLQVTKCSCGNAAADEEAPPADDGGSSSCPHFDVTLTMNPERCVKLHQVVRAIEQDRCVEIVKASSSSACVGEGGKIVYTIKCRARSSDLDAPMVASRISRLFIE